MARRKFTATDLEAAAAARAKYAGTAKARGASLKAAATRSGFADHCDRFWSRVLRSDGCWEWQGAKAGGKYGCFRIGAIRIQAHRYAWTSTNGAIERGVMVLHRCDNMLCVRPDHLFLGTQTDNMQDAKRKGRAYRPGQHNTQGADGRWQTKKK